MIAREPRLAGLEDNPVFRLIHFHRHLQGTSRAGLGRALRWLLYIFLLFTCPPGILVAWIIFSSREQLGPPRKRFERLTQIPEAYLEDLDLAAVRPDEYAIAVWGSSVTRRKIEIDWIILIIVFALTAYGLMMILSGNQATELTNILGAFAAIVLFAIFARAGLLLQAPYHPLGLQRVRLRRLRRSIELRSKPWRAALIILIGILAFYGLWTGVANFLVAMFRLDWSWLEELLGNPGIFPAEIIGACALGLIAGLARGRHFRRESTRMVEQMAAELEFVKNWLGEQSRKAVEQK